MSQPILRVVPQRAKADCAVAVLAMISGLRYEEAATAFGRPHESDWEEGCLLRDIVDAGKKVGISLETRPSGKYDISSDAGALAIKMQTRWHTVVLCRGWIFDTDGYVWTVDDYLEAHKDEDPYLGAMLIPVYSPQPAETTTELGRSYRRFRL